MKRAKFMLAAIAVLAVAGGVFASKGRITDVVFTKTNPATNICDVPLTSYTTQPGGAFYRTTYVTLEQGAVCTTHPIYRGL